MRHSFRSFAMLFQRSTQRIARSPTRRRSVTRLRSVTCLLCAWSVAGPAWGVQIQFGDGTANTRPVPSGDPGFSHVGNRGGSSGVYLGDGWVLTAAHVPAGDILLGTTVYDWVPESDTVIRNPEGRGLSEFADLRMFRLTTLPPLANLSISSSAPTAGTVVMMAGNGKDRAPNLTGWSVVGTAQNPVWTETSPAGTRGRQNGYFYLNSNSLRWGTNQIATQSATNNQTVFTVGGGTRDTLSINTIFDDLAETTEAQGATNDSGGGVFVLGKRGWELGGIMYAIGVEAGQPDQTSVFGNRTYAAALHEYLPQIQARMLEWRVDINSDNTIDAFDAGVLLSEWGAGGGTSDFNLDGVVDARDASVLFEFWSADFSSTPALGSLAGDDLSGMPHYATEIPRITLSGGAMNVPEPPSLLVPGLIATGLACGSRGRRKRSAP